MKFFGDVGAMTPQRCTVQPSFALQDQKPIEEMQREREREDEWMTQQRIQLLGPCTPLLRVKSHFIH